MTAEEVFQKLSQELLESAGEDRPLFEAILSLLKPRLLPRIEARIRLRMPQVPEPQTRALTEPITPAPSVGELTAWQGRRGGQLDPNQLQLGLRVVLDDGKHGSVMVIKEEPKYTYERSTDMRLHTVVDKQFWVTLRLDSGSEKVLLATRLFEELAPPLQVPRDVTVKDGMQPPQVVWKNLVYYDESPRYSNDDYRTLLIGLERFLQKHGLLVAFYPESRSFHPIRFYWNMPQDIGLRLRLDELLTGVTFDDRGGSFRLQALLSEEESELRVNTVYRDVLAHEFAHALREQSRLTLSLLGEAYLRYSAEAPDGPALNPPRSEIVASSNATSGAHGGDSTGCTDTTFYSQTFGKVVVKCGRSNKQGRRFNNVQTALAGGFYGHDGARWTMNRVPSDALLAELRANGQTFFDVSREVIPEPLHEPLYVPSLTRTVAPAYTPALPVYTGEQVPACGCSHRRGSTLFESDKSTSDDPSEAMIRFQARRQVGRTSPSA